MEIRENLIISERDIIHDNNYEYLLNHRLFLLDRLISTHVYKNIFFFFLDEFELPRFILNQEIDIFKIIKNSVRHSPTELNLVLGAPMQDRILYDLRNYVNDMNIINVPTASLFSTIRNKCLNIDMDVEEFEEKGLHSETSKKKLLTCLNRQPHSHRCTFIDILSEFDLIENNDVSWNIIRDDFDFKFFSQRKIIIDNDMESNDYMKHVFSDFNTNSVFNIVTESSSKYIFYSEKTWKSMLNINSIPIIIGARGINKKLKDFGFELFDEIIDYSFDELDCFEERSMNICRQLKNLQNHNFDNLFNKVKEKIFHNYHQCFLIYKNNKFIPNELSQLIDYESTFNNIFIEGQNKSIMKAMS